MINLLWQLWNLPSLTPGKRGQKSSDLTPSLCCLTHSSKFSLRSGEVQASQRGLLGFLLQCLLAFSLTLYTMAIPHHSGSGGEGFSMPPAPFLSLWHLSCPLAASGILEDSAGAFLPPGQTAQARIMPSCPPAAQFQCSQYLWRERRKGKNSTLSLKGIALSNPNSKAGTLLSCPVVFAIKWT